MTRQPFATRSTLDIPAPVVTDSGFTDLPAPMKLIHELLRHAGLRACHIEQGPDGTSWSISTLHRTDRGTWSAWKSTLDAGQLRAAMANDRARHRLIAHLARELAPHSNSIT